jgi:glycerol-1-phosphate dehydrogenase [NAD(P)+]
MAERFVKQKINIPRRRAAIGEVPREYGYGIVANACAGDERWLVATVPEAWAIVAPMFGRPPRIVHKVRSMDGDTVASEVERLPEVDAVLGVGDRDALDFAKYVAWHRNLPLVLAPATICADSCLTDTIAIRCNHRVRYIGEVYPRRVLIDFELVCSGPAEVNRAGASDILSIHTSLEDWRLASQREIEVYDAVAAQRARALLTKLMDRADDIREAKPAGIVTLVELFWSSVDLCRRSRTSRLNEGSEHFWAYNAEYVGRRRFVHGELIALGIVMMSALQGNGPAAVREKIDALGIRRDPARIGLSGVELRKSLMTARQYAEADHLAYSILNECEITPAMAEELVAAAMET